MRRTIVVAMLALVACAPEGRVRTLSPDELPTDLYASPSPVPTAAPARDVSIWFVRDDRLVSVVRQASGTGSLAEFALRAVIEGPTPEETDDGVSSAIPDGAELLEVMVEEGIATVNLSKEFELGAEDVQLLRLGQVVYTVTGLSDVRRVRFMIDSEPASVVSQDGTAHEDVGRSDYSRLVEPPPTATPAGG